MRDHKEQWQIVNWSLMNNSCMDCKFHITGVSWYAPSRKERIQISRRVMKNRGRTKKTRWEGSCVNPKNGEKFPPFTSTFCSKSLSGCIKKHLIYRMWLMQQAFLHATGCKFSEQLRTYHDIKLRQEILFVTCIWVIASFKEPKLFVHSWQTSCFETCMKRVFDHFAEHCWACVEIFFIISRSRGLASHFMYLPVPSPGPT